MQLTKKKYEIESIRNSQVYMKESEDYLLGLYYQIL